MNQPSNIEPLQRRVLLSQYVKTGFTTVEFADFSEEFSPALMASLIGQKFLVVGSMIDADAGETRVVMAQFNAAGQPVSAGVAGIAVDRIIGAQAQPDGTLLVLGLLNQNYLVARYTPAETLDTSFSGDGVAPVPIQTNLLGGGIEFAADGKIVFLGGTGSVSEGTAKPLVARLTSAGALDTTFDGDGLAAPPAAISGAGSALLVQPDGKILFASRPDIGSFLGRYNADGSVDTSFGDNGVASFPDFSIASMEVLAEGKILITAGSQSIARLTPTGQLDTSFGDDGIAAMLSDVKVSDGAKFYVGSDDKITVLSIWGTSRFTADGHLDPSYGLGRRIDAFDPATTYDLGGPYLGGLRVAALTGNGDVLLSGAGPANLIPVLRLSLASLPDVSLNSGTLSIAGTGKADTIAVATIGDQVQVTRNGDVQMFPRAQVKLVEIDSGGGNDSITVSLDVATSILGGLGDDTIVTGSAADSVDAGAGNDSVSSGGGDDRIAAGEGNDTVLSGDGRDEVTSIAGDDVIDAGAGNDVIRSASGRNDLNGGNGDDYISAGAGNDVIRGGSGADRILAGDGSNLVYGGDGNDSIKVGAGSDTLWGEIGYDTIKAGSGDDLINGGAGKDRIWGQNGNDRLYGRRGNDAMDGGAGDDRLVGDEGHDKFFGGAGNDVLFAMDNNSDYMDGGSGSDTSLCDELLDEILNVELS
ncbi:MAG TPA: hypothetical protein VH518_12990 [Tepidisphaeraceae bacterium]|jgi:uncharacterized delta-60 repeat protein